MKQLGLSLLRAESESEVSGIIDSESMMSDNKNWQWIDDRETNFNTITNQATTGGKAATELITNMVDAMLMKRCWEEKIDPKSKNAPSTMYQAVDAWIEKLNGGRIINAADDWLRNYANKNLVIGITGRPTGDRPCYTFADNGEGQHPSDFPDTFLSLSAKRKSEIPFVQGKYNMGSSGVLNFCGKRRFKLIVSRRYDESGDWGWTLVRRHPDKGNGMPSFEYFAPGKNTPTLGNLRTLYPLYLKDGDRYEGFHLDSGTAVKLYDFYVGKNFTGFRGAREAFIENLVETILPFRILDFRVSPDLKRKGERRLGIDPRSFYGMEFLLRRSHHEYSDGSEDSDPEKLVESETEKSLSVGTIADPQLGKITVTAVPLKKQLKTHWFLRSRCRVFHHVNGQVQFKQGRDFINQCRIPALKDRVAIFVNASELKDMAHQEIWKGDRESILENDIGEDYKERIKEIIQNSTVLKDLNHRIAREELDSVAKESSHALVHDLVTRDHNLMHLLDGNYPGVPVPPIPPATKEPRVQLRYSPTFVKVEGRRLDMPLPLNRTRPISCLTDAQEDYFIRASNRGRLRFESDKTENLFSFKFLLDGLGKLTIFVAPDKGKVKPGDEHRFKVGLKDDAMAAPIYSREEICIKIEEPEKRPRPNPNPRPRPTPHRSSERGLPPPHLLTSDGREIKGQSSIKWVEGPFQSEPCNEHDGGYVADFGEEGKKYYINYDNACFQNYLSNQKNEQDKTAVMEKYILGMRIALLGAERALESEKDNEDFDGDKFRRMAAKGAAAVVMTLCDQLPKSFDLFSDENEK